MPGVARLLLGIVFLLATRVYAQPFISKFQILDVDNGLSQNSVYAILQDSIGFIWIGTGDGLNRFDGKRIRNYRFQSDSLEVAGTNVIRGNLCEDKLARIWFANETGIYFYDPVDDKLQRAENFISEPSEGFVYYQSIYLDHDYFWILYPTHGLLRFNILDGSQQLFKFPSQVNFTSYALHATRSGDKILIRIHEQPGILVFDTRSESYTLQFLDYFSLSPRPTRKDFFLTQGKSLFRFDSARNDIVAIPLQANDNLSDVVADQDGIIYASSASRGLFVFQPNSGITSNIRQNENLPGSLSSDILTHLLIDRDRNLWVGTDGGGVARVDLKSPRFNLFPKIAGANQMLGNYFIRCFAEDASGKIWFGTQQTGLGLFNPSDESVIFFNLPEAGKSSHLNSVTALLCRQNDELWVGHYGGISIFDLRSHTFKSIRLEPDYFKTAPYPVYQLLEIEKGVIMAATHYGVYKIQNLNGNYLGKNWKGFDSNASNIIAEENGSIWVATQNEGLIHTRAAETERANDKRFFNHINIRSVHRDEQDPTIFWLCTGSGIIRFDTQSQQNESFNGITGGPRGIVYGILEDLMNNFWISTNQGLYFYDKKADNFQKFTSKDGLQSNEFNTGAFFKSSNGTMYFGGIRGFNWFKTNAESLNRTAPQSKVTSIYIKGILHTGDKQFADSRVITLPYDHNDVAFDFAVLDYSKPLSNQAQYLLDNWDHKWTTTDQMTARYPNLPPGHYQFKVKGSNEGKLWGAEDIVSITVLTPWWQAKWFYAMAIIFVVALLISATRYASQMKLNRQLRELEKQQVIFQERERISKDLHDDLGTGLSRISILSDLARRSAHNLQFTDRHLDRINETARDLITNMGELIWSHNPSFDHLDNLLSYVREHLSEAFDTTEIALHIEVPEMKREIAISAELRRNIFLIVKESLHNILKHSGASNAYLIFKLNGTELQFDVKDDGKGMDLEASKNKGRGLANLASRVAVCKGHFSIASGPGKGTTFVFRIPLG